MEKLCKADVFKANFHLIIYNNSEILIIENRTLHNHYHFWLFSLHYLSMANCFCWWSTNEKTYRYIKSFYCVFQ